MSTQKRASRSSRSADCGGENWRRRQRTSCTERAGVRGSLVPPSLARFGCADAGGVTAPLLSILWSIGAWVATKFLHVDSPTRHRVRLVLKAECKVSPPPFGAHRPRLGDLGVPVFPRSSLPPIPFPTGLTRLHWTLPQAPDAHQRRAERYDGKRDLYFLHAA